MSNLIRSAGKRDGTLDSMATSWLESPGLGACQRLPLAIWARARCAQRVWGLPEPERSGESTEGETSVANEVQSH